MSRPGQPLRVSAAWTRLVADVRQLRAAGAPPPCLADPTTSHWWTSEDPAERAQAARACRACPVRRECGRAADDLGLRFATWGGRDRTPKPTGKAVPVAS